MIDISDNFHEVATGSVRPLAVDLGVSWDKVMVPTTYWFTLDQSQLDGTDLVALVSNPDPIMDWNTYTYENETERLINVSYSRSVKFPYNVQSAVADVQLNNYDGRYTIDGNSDISSDILPKRPMRIQSGFRVGGLRPVVPSFFGLTENVPKYSGKNDSVASLTALDFLTDIANKQLNDTVVMKDARTDEVIKVILEQYDIDPKIIKLSKGANVIPFVVINNGDNAGSVLNKLVQAENGSLWLDEMGNIRFENRAGDVDAEVVYEFDDSNIVEFKPSHDDSIVNRVKIKSDVRKVQEFQPIFQASNENGYESSDDAYRIGAYGNLEVWFNLDDPAWTASDLIFNGEETNSRFTALDLSGGRVVSGIGASGYLFTDTYKVTFSNANGFPVSLDFIELWGEPAKVVDTIDYDAYDTDSVEKFGEKVLEITDNSFFGSYKTADLYATYILENYSEYSPRVELTVKGNPALQLGDVVHIVHGNIEDDFKITSISSRYDSNGNTFTITADRYSSISLFITNKSLLNGTDVLGV